MIDQDDETIWGLYAKGVKKLHENEVEAPPKKRPIKKAASKPVEQAPVSEMESLIQKSTPPRDLGCEAPASPPPQRTWKKEPLDLRIERNMSLGDVVIEARLDLHGQTEQAAFDSFRSFIETQRARGKRMLLVITGKGAGGASVLRANLPRWCNTPSFEEGVLAVRTAAQHHGGDGAYYVLLRKKP